MRVCVFGTGYVGLVQAAVLAEHGHHVHCIDVNQEKIDAINRGEMPIYEHDLAPMVIKNTQAGHLQFSTDAKPAVKEAQVLFIAVGTPPAEDGSADLKYVKAVAQEIASLVDENDRFSQKVVVIKSTVPVGTGDMVESIITETLTARGLAGQIQIEVVSNPEFLKEGHAVADCMKPDRIIVGTREGDTISEPVMQQLYATFNHNKNRMIFMGRRDSELTKYTANCMLATRISFMNEISNIAEKVGVDIQNVRKGIGSDPRIGSFFLYPGCGYGGSCFPKDVAALIQSAKDVGINPQILQSVEDVNDRQKRKLAEKIISHFGSDLRGKTFAMWGLAFKPDTDDIREAPSHTIMKILWDAGANIQAHDYEAMPNIAAQYVGNAQLHLCSNKEDALNGADALILCTEWTQYRNIDFATLHERMSKQEDLAIFDGRNIYNPSLCEMNGFAYYGIGVGRSS